MSEAIAYPFQPGRWLTLGLKPLPPREWLEQDASFIQQVELKRQLLQEHPDEVFACQPQSIAAQQEVLDLLIAHLLQVYPQQYQQQGNNLFCRLTGQSWQLTDFRQHPLKLAGQLGQEDWCVLLPQEETYGLAAGLVCFPFHWRLQDKLGRSLTGIHAPVPDYCDKLSRPVDTLFDRLRPDYPSIRFNWGITKIPDLFLPANHSDNPADGIDPASDPAITIETAGDRLWLRIERQTLRRLPQTGGIVFGIHTTIEPLHQVKSNPAAAHSLAAAIEQLPANARLYKNLLPLQSVLLSYLRG